MERDQAQKQIDLLTRIAVALEKSNTKTSSQNNTDLSANSILDVVKVITDDHASKMASKAAGFHDMPGFEGTLDALDNLTNLHPVDKLQGDVENYINEEFEKDPYTYEHEFDKNGDNSVAEYRCSIKNDSDFSIRQAADSYQAALDCETHFTSKKECILDYVTNEFGILGARYTDIIKFAFYLGNPNSYKYTNENRGYYSCAFNSRFGGHLVKGGKDCLVKGINNAGDERYFALSFVDQATEYYKRLA